MIRGLPTVDVPCGLCATMIREWRQVGPDDDDLVAQPCGHSLIDHFVEWADRLKQKR